jgi:hypothetical protein
LTPNREHDRATRLARQRSTQPEPSSDAGRSRDRRVRAAVAGSKLGNRFAFTSDPDVRLYLFSLMTPAPTT